MRCTLMGRGTAVVLGVTLFSILTPGVALGQG
jgi:hypothetical protein